MNELLFLCLTSQDVTHKVSSVQAVLVTGIFFQIGLDFDKYVQTSNKSLRFPDGIKAVGKSYRPAD